MLSKSSLNINFYLCHWCHCGLLLVTLTKQIIINATAGVCTHSVVKIQEKKTIQYREIKDVFREEDKFKLEFERLH